MGRCPGHPREIPSGPAGRVSEFLATVHEGLMAQKDNPVFVAWAMKDPAFTPEYLNGLWLGDYPQAKLLRLEDASHYLQEDAHERIVPALVDFLHRN